MNIRVNQAFKNIDTKWLSLKGISVKEIRIFLAMQESNFTVKEEVKL
ncbi:hypothetical protein ACFQ4X_14460 [Fictibacillus halophilus]